MAGNNRMFGGKHEPVVVFDTWTEEIYATLTDAGNDLARQHGEFPSDYSWYQHSEMYPGRFIDRISGGRSVGLVA